MSEHLIDVATELARLLAELHGRYAPDDLLERLAVALRQLWVEREHLVGIARAAQGLFRPKITVIDAESLARLRTALVMSDAETETDLFLDAIGRNITYLDQIKTLRGALEEIHDTTVSQVSAMIAERALAACGRLPHE